MINFSIIYNKNDTLDRTYETLIEENKTILELKLNILEGFPNLDFNQFCIVLPNYGILDFEEFLELPLAALGLQSGNNNLYYLFIVNIENINDIWKYVCSKEILKGQFITQMGYKIDSVPLCFACKFTCRKNITQAELITECTFSCLCQIMNTKNNNYNKCFFEKCELSNLIDDKSIMMGNINSIITNHAEVRLKKEKAKMQEINKKILERNYDFAKSIKFGLQRVFMYEDNQVRAKVLSSIPIKDLETEAQEMINKNEKLSYKDELVKCLLFWFKKKFYTWCDKPLCSKCKIPCVNYVDTLQPNEEETRWLASRTEVYQCSCGENSRFPRYNNPAKLCDTKTGRCGEWANLFGCILRCLDYDVRFIDNFEDHVWNEYYSHFYKKWIHVDSCENAWDTPLIYEQGWGRNMTYLLAYSVEGIYDVTRRYVKNYEIIQNRRKKEVENVLLSLLETQNNFIRENVAPEKIEFLFDRDSEERSQLLGEKIIKENELVERQSGSEDWRKNRGEMK